MNIAKLAIIAIVTPIIFIVGFSIVLPLAAVLTEPSMLPVDSIVMSFLSTLATVMLTGAMVQLAIRSVLATINNA